jgi:hypothetical protein
VVDGEEEDVVEGEEDEVVVGADVDVVAGEEDCALVLDDVLVVLVIVDVADLVAR